MMISTKPMSSPSRTEKFPPPLMRFLMSNVGSRSRGRSRSSPMFVRKKNTVIETQEPSSPKVTCIGQVRVRRSSKQSGTKFGGRSGRSRAPAGGPCSCWWVQKALFCHHFAKRLRPRSFRPLWRKWVWFVRFGYCRRAEIRDDSSKMESNRKGKYRATDRKDENDEDDDEEEAQVKVAPSEAFNSSTPPKNALLLTRCRSAPYRSSSLASPFWGSPLAASSETENNNEENKALQQQHQQLEDREQEIPTSENEPNSRDSTSELRTDQKSKRNLGASAEFEVPINGKTKETSLQELETGKGGGSAWPPILTRSKSEPARTGARLKPEASFWRNSRFGFAEPSSPHVYD